MLEDANNSDSQKIEVKNKSLEKTGIEVSKPTNKVMESIYPTPMRGIGTAAQVHAKQDSESAPEKPAESAVVSAAEPNPPILPATAGNGQESLAVVKTLSKRGLEYLLATILLWSLALSLTAVLIFLIYGKNYFSVMSIAASISLVSLPFFIYLTLRLKKAEIADPTLRTESSRRRLAQFSQILSFSICFINSITFLDHLFQLIGGGTDEQITQATLSYLSVMLVSGGIFAYYWLSSRLSKLNGIGQ